MSTDKKCYNCNQPLRSTLEILTGCCFNCIKNHTMSKIDHILPSLPVVVVEHITELQTNLQKTEKELAIAVRLAKQLNSKLDSIEQTVNRLTAKQ